MPATICSDCREQHQIRVKDATQFSDGTTFWCVVCNLKAKLADANERAVHVYNSGYLTGHHDTVEGAFIDIVNCDMDTYHEDVVRDLLADLAARARED